MALKFKRQSFIGLSYVMAFIVFVSPFASVAKETVTPAHVYERVQEVRAELELLRYHMGRPKSSALPVHVINVVPQEVYYQAQTLLKKSNRLSFELTRTVIETPSSPDIVKPADVLVIVNAVTKQLNEIKLELNIVDEIKSAKFDPDMQSDDVFQVMVQANRQLNLLLDKEFSPGDAFEQLTLAVAYAARLRSLFPGDRIPAQDKLIKGKQPKDVYRLLVECFVLLSEISNNTVMQLNTTEQEIQQVTPSDVYDIASMIVAELAYFHHHRADLPEPRPVYHPGRKFPSDVFQRGMLLRQQLMELKSFVKQYPDWLDSGQYPK